MKKKNIFYFIGILTLLTIITYLNTLSPNVMIKGDDELIAGYPFKHFEKESILTYHEFPMWNPYIFGGLPFIDAIHGDIFFWTAWIRLVLPIHVTMVLVFIVHIVIAGIFMFLFLKSLGIKEKISMVGGISYAFTGWIVSMTYAGHAAKVVVASFLPFVLYFLNKGINEQKLKWFILAGIGIGFGLLVPHVQLVYYLLILSFLFTLWKLFFVYREERKFKKVVKLFIFFWIAVGTGFLISSIQVLPGYSYIPFSPRAGTGRGYEFAISWSLPPLEILDWINPNFSGILENYWGLNYFKQHTEYFSVIVLFFAIIGIVLKWKNRYVKFFFFYMIFGVLMALGGYTPFYRIPYHLFPMLSKFRAPALIFFTVSFSFVVLAMYGLEIVVEKSNFKEQKKIKYIIYSFIGIIFVFLLFSLRKDSFLEFLKNTITPFIEKKYGARMLQQKILILENNYINIVKGLFVALLFILMVSTVILLKKKIKKEWSVYFITALIFIDLFVINKHFIKTVDAPSVFYAEDEIVRFLKKDTSLFRVFPLYYREDDYLMLHNIQSLGGYHGNQLKRYQEFIGAPHTIMFRDYENLFYLNFINLLNTKYIIAPILPEDVKNYPLSLQLVILKLKHYLSNFKEIFKGRKFSIYLNEKALPRAFMVYDYEVITVDSLIIDKLRSKDFIPRKKAILEKNPNIIPVDSDSVYSTVKIKSYKPNKIKIYVSTSHEGLLVLSENWYPFWKAKVDGKNVEVLRAYYTLRAVKIPKGIHEVIFYFDSPYFKCGKWITIITLLLVLLYLISSSVFYRYRIYKK